MHDVISKTLKVCKYNYQIASLAKTSTQSLMVIKKIKMPSQIVGIAIDLLTRIPIGKTQQDKLDSYIMDLIGRKLVTNLTQTSNGNISPPDITSSRE